ncbi:MAG: hypothetical protein PHI42_06215 [Paludibacteraceae bacterium]|nr:hypothetical protein [Paludibacteraceae bacterium]
MMKRNKTILVVLICLLILGGLAAWYFTKDKGLDDKNKLAPKASAKADGLFRIEEYTISDSDVDDDDLCFVPSLCASKGCSESDFYDHNGSRKYLIKGQKVLLPFKVK